MNNSIFLSLLLCLIFAAPVVAEPVKTGRAIPTKTPGHLKPATSATVKTEKMFTIKSVSDMGPMEINMCSLGLRLKGKIGNSLWRPSEPNIAILINPENKTYLPVPVEDYISDLRDEDFPPVIADKANSRMAKTNLPGGFSGTECSVINKFEDGSERTFARVTGVKKIAVSDPVHRMWCRYSGFVGPDIGIPVSIYRIRRHKYEGERRRRRSSYEERVEKLRSFLVPVELKSSAVVPSLFVPPTGYHKAKDHAALYLSNDGDMKESDMEDLFRVPMK